MKKAFSNPLIVYFAFVFGTLTCSDFLDVRKNSPEAVFTDNFWHSFADNLFRTATNHLRVGFAHELIAQIRTAPNKDEGGLLNNGLQLGLSRAQIVRKYLDAVGVTGRKHKECSQQSRAKNTGC